MIEHLSYSSISSFLLCPRSWRYKYIDKVPTKTSPNLILGSAFHATVEKLVSEPEINPTELFAEKWSGIIEDEGKDIDWQDKTPESVRDEGLRLFQSPEILAGIKQIIPKRDIDGNPLIEKYVELKVPNVPVPIIGYIDIILKDGTPADFKTAARKWTDEQAANSLQSLFYIAALLQAGLPVNWKFKHLVFVKTKVPAFQELEHSHTAGELFFLFDIVQSVWKAIENEVFIPQTDGWKCSPLYCDYFPICKGATK